MAKDNTKFKDLTEEASQRPDEKAADTLRGAENDDINEETFLGRVPSPNGDDAAENKVATSLDDE